MKIGTPDRILRINIVLNRTGLCRSTLHRKMDKGPFLRNIKITDCCTGWRESAVRAWIDNPMLYSAEDQPGS